MKHHNSLCCVCLANLCYDCCALKPISVARVLNALGTSYTILSRDVVYDKQEGRRIAVLAAARNIALTPLFHGAVAQHMPGGRFDTVLFLNDIIFCAADVLEVLYAKAEQGAHEACSVDWDWGGRNIYDRWVLRALSGRCVALSLVLLIISLIFG